MKGITCTVREGREVYPVMGKEGRGKGMRVSQGKLIDPTTQMENEWRERERKKNVLVLVLDNQYKHLQSRCVMELHSRFQFYFLSAVHRFRFLPFSSIFLSYGHCLSKLTCC